MSLNGGSSREEFGDPELSAHTSPPPALYTSSWPRNKDSKHPQTPTMLCSAHFPTARRLRIVTNMKTKKRCREEKIENTIRWQEQLSVPLTSTTLRLKSTFTLMTFYYRLDRKRILTCKKCFISDSTSVYFHYIQHLL